MKSSLGLIPIVALALGLAGCTVGPDYKQPTLPPGSMAPLASFNPAAESRHPAQDQWWQLYQDPALNTLLAEAFQANENLKAAEANLSAARAILESARVGQYPSTELSAGGTYGRDPSENLILELTGRKPTTDWLFDSMLDSSYELDLFGRVRRTVEAKRDNEGAAEAARDAVKITVAAETTRAYAEICTIGEQIEVAQGSLDVVTRAAKIANSREQAGANSQIEVARAVALVDETRATIPPLEGHRRAAWFELAALLGRTPENAPVSVLSCSIAPHLSAPLPVGDGAALLRRRPDVRQAERLLAADTASIGIAVADLYPRISLTGFYGGFSDKIDLLDTENALGWGVGPAMSWSFPNIAGPLAHIRQSKANAAGSLARFDGVVLNALKETEQALSLYTAELDHHAALVQFDEQAERVFTLTRSQFGAGSLSQLDMLDAQRTLLAARAAVAASDQALAEDQIGVFKSLGGGWEAATAAPQR